MNKHFSLSGGMSCHSFCRTLLLSGFLLAGTIGTSAFAAPTITDGTYVSGSVYNSGSPYSYATGVPNNTFGTININYTNGILTQTGSASDPAYPSTSATSTASLSANQLSLSLSGSSGYTSATAQMWDTLTFGNLPTGGTVNANTVLGILNMTVTGSIGNAKYGANGYAGYGLDLYNTASFLPSSFGGGCGYTDGMSCSGLNASSGQSSTLFSPGSQTFSIGITQGDLTNGSLAFIAEIQASNYSDPSLSAPLVIDPSITLTGLYSGVTVSSYSGYNYSGGSVSAVPEPSSYAMLLAGLGLIGFISYRSKNDSSNLLMAA